MAAPRNTTYELIYHIGRGNVTETEIPQVLSTIFDAPDYKDCTQRLREKDLVMWVERLDQIIDSTIYPEELRKRTLRTLRKICGSRRVLPKSHYFLGRLHKNSSRPVSGGTADVWRVEDDQRRVYAAKVFRINFSGDRYKIERYFEEVTVWKRLNHPNILTNLGAGPDIAEFCVVSPWIPEGELLQYLGKFPGANRVSIMIGIADGLSYLHSNDVVHGDLKGANILFNGMGIPLIIDFGISSMNFNPRAINDTPRGYSPRWAAPEILEATNANGCPTKMSDVYSFACVVIEIFTGNLPFPDLSDLNVYLVVVKGKRPPRPTDALKLGLSSGAWKLVQDCWNKKQYERPDMQYVAHRLRKS